MNSQLVIVLSILLFVGSAYSLQCYVCAEESCDKLKELKAQNCSRDSLKNVGPGIMNYTAVPFNTEITGADPPFDCQKVEATDSNGKVHVARRCQVRLPANESCVHFTRAIGVEREYRNATCSICSEDSCNAAQRVQVWSMFLAPTLLLTGFFMLFA